MPAKLNHLVEKFLVALLVVFLHFGGAIAVFTNEENRYFYIWDPLDAFARIFAMLLLAVAATGAALAAGYLVRRWRLPRVGRLLEHLFLVALTSGLLATLASPDLKHREVVLDVAWMVAMAVIGFSLAWQRSRLVVWAVRACLIFSPAPVIISLQMLTWENWEDPPRTQVAARQASSPKAPVFVFVFDGWSRQRSMHSGDFLPYFKNIRRLCEQAIVFHEARSPAEETDGSLPAMIYQRPAKLLWKGGRTYWRIDGTEVPSTEVPSLFQLSRDQGYNSYMLGWYLPYPRILGDQADYCRTFPLYFKSEGLSGRMLAAAYEAHSYLSDPLSKRLSAPLKQVDYRDHYRVAQSIGKESRAILLSCPVNTFAFFHHVPPHSPFVFNEDGTYRRSGKGILSDGPDGYEPSLEYVDLLVGESMDILRERGSFDQALIVLTSDHSWRRDPEPRHREDPDWARQIPLLIKLPGQQSRIDIDDAIRTDELKPLFEAVFRGQGDTKSLISLVEHLAALN